MSSAIISFDEMERKSQQTKGWALAAKNTRNRIVTAVLLGFVAHALKGLVNTLSPDMLDELSEENAAQLKTDLQELHCLLVSFCSAPTLRHLHNTPIFSSFMGTIHESSEDLADRIESLALSENQDFKLLLSTCVEDIKTTAASSGRM